MSDGENTSFFGKIMNSIGGVVMGLTMVPASFGVVTCAALQERTAEALHDATPVAESVSGKASYASGRIQANPIGDPPYVKPGAYLTLSRSVQIYAWRQVSAGKDSNDKPIYKCETAWTGSPSTNIGSKEGCSGKYNPAIRTRETSNKASIRLSADGKVFSVASAADFYGMPSAKVDSQNVSGLIAAGGYYYQNNRCANSPNVGCERISYSGTGYDPQGEYTVIGKAQGNSIGEYTSDRDNKYLVLGAGGFDKTMEAIKSADRLKAMGFLIGSIIMLGVGLAMIVGPLLSLIEYIPFIGGFSANLIRIIFFIIAAIVMTITYVFLRYWYIMLALFLIAMAAVAYIAYTRRQKAQAA